MKRWKKILLGTLLVLALALGGLCLWQWDNIRAVYDFLTLDSGQIAQNLESKREEHHQAILDALGDLPMSAPTTEQSDAILSGQMTPEEVKDALGITGQLENQKEPVEEAPEGTEGPAPPAYTWEELVAGCVAELYACKVDTMAVLADMKREALAEWNAIPAEERTSTRMKEFGLSGLEQCYDLEVEVDRQVKDILSRCRDKLAQIGADDAILDDLWGYYEDEKVAEKTYYLDKYLN